eukprot:sb/3471088/
MTICMYSNWISVIFSDTHTNSLPLSLTLSLSHSLSLSLSHSLTLSLSLSPIPFGVQAGGIYSKRAARLLNEPREKRKRRYNLINLINKLHYRIVNGVSLSHFSSQMGSLKKFSSYTVDMRCRSLVRAFSTPPRDLGVGTRSRPRLRLVRTRHNFAVDFLAGAISPAPEVRLTKFQRQSMVLDIFYLPVYV